MNIKAKHDITESISQSASFSSRRRHHPNM